MISYSTCSGLLSPFFSCHIAADCGVSSLTFTFPECLTRTLSRKAQCRFIHHLDKNVDSTSLLMILVHSRTCCRLWLLFRMALTEVSETNIRRNGIVLPLPIASTDTDKIPISSSNSLEVSASSIQRMLKTTTELGDISVFSARPSQLSVSQSQIIRRRSSSLGSSFNSTRYQGAGAHRQLSHPSKHRLSRKDTTISNTTSYGSGHRPRGLRQPPPHVARQYGPRYALASHGLYNRRSSTTLRSHDGITGLRKQSSYALGPGEGAGRADSLAYNEMHGLHPRPFYYDTSSFASSPSSNYFWPNYRRASVYNPEYNRSVSSFARSPSPAFLPGCSSVRSSPYPSRTVTPVSLRLPSPPTVPLSRQDGPNRLPRSPTGLSSPTYYDYSESFEDAGNTTSRQDSTIFSLPFNLEATIHEHEPAPVIRQAQTPFGIVQGSVFVPSELPTEANRCDHEEGSGAPAQQLQSRTASLEPLTVVGVPKSGMDTKESKVGSQSLLMTMLVERSLC